MLTLDHPCNRSCLNCDINCADVTRLTNAEASRCFSLVTPNHNSGDVLVLNLPELQHNIIFRFDTVRTKYLESHRVCQTTENWSKSR